MMCILEMVQVLFFNFVFMDCILIKLSLMRVLVWSVILMKGTELWTSVSNPFKAGLSSSRDKNL